MHRVAPAVAPVSLSVLVLVLVFVFVLVLALLLPSFIVIFISTFKALTCHILSLPFPAPQDDQKEEGTHSAKNSRR